MKTVEICCSKTCGNFGRCYGNQGWAETVENQKLFLKISSFEKSESFNSVAQGVLEIFWKVYLGGHNVPPPALNRVKGVVSVFGVAYPAGFGSLKAITKCFWSRKVGHINGLFVLEVESGGCIFRCRKNQTNERKTSTLYSLLKTVLPWRSTDAITGHQLRADAGDIAHRHRSAVDVQDSASLFALPCSRFLVPCSTILSPRSKAHQREICAGYCCCSPAPYVRPRELLEQSQLFAGRPTSGTKRSHPFLRKAQASLLARQLRGQQALRRLHDGQRCTCPAWRVHSFRCGRRASLQFSKNFRTSPAGTHRGLRE